MSSFEMKARRAIENVALLYQHNDADTDLISVGERWFDSVKFVLSIIAPRAKHFDTPIEWARSVREELVRLQEEEGLGRKAAVATLEARLDSITSDHKRFKSESNFEPNKRSRSATSTTIERKNLKKLKQALKRTRDDL